MQLNYVSNFWGKDQILKILLMEGSRKFLDTEMNDWLRRQGERAKTDKAHLEELIRLNLVIESSESGGSMVLRFLHINEAYRKYLEELLWK